MRRQLKKIGLAGLAAGTAAAVIAPPPASAGKAPFGSPYADSRTHDFYSSELTQSDKAFWDPIITGEMEDNWAANTVLSAVKRTSYVSNVDFHWVVQSATYFSNPAAAAETHCESFSSSTRCDRFLIRIKDDAQGNLSYGANKNLACHEIGHTLGFRDGGTDGTSCMDSGDNGQIGTYEIGKVNNFY